MKSCKVIVCIDRLDKTDGHVWAVRAGNKWRTAKTVDVSVPLSTRFKGLSARQPKAFLEGVGVVRAHRGGHVTITQN